MKRVEVHAESRTRSARLYEASAILGVLLFFFGPVLTLLLGHSALLAGTLGYTGITLFAGGVAARYEFMRSASGIVQLVKNIFVAGGVTSVFYGIFLLLYYL